MLKVAVVLQQPRTLFRTLVVEPECFFFEPGFSKIAFSIPGQKPYLVVAMPPSHWGTVLSYPHPVTGHSRFCDVVSEKIGRETISDVPGRFQRGHASKIPECKLSEFGGENDRNLAVTVALKKRVILIIKMRFPTFQALTEATVATVYKDHSVVEDVNKKRPKALEVAEVRCMWSCNV